MDDNNNQNEAIKKGAKLIDVAFDDSAIKTEIDGFMAKDEEAMLKVITTEIAHVKLHMACYLKKAESPLWDGLVKATACPDSYKLVGFASQNTRVLMSLFGNTILCDAIGGTKKVQP